MNIKPPQITESVSELKSLLKKTSIGCQKQRLTAIYLFRITNFKYFTKVANGI